MHMQNSKASLILKGVLNEVLNLPFRLFLIWFNAIVIIYISFIFTYNQSTLLAVFSPLLPFLYALPSLFHCNMFLNAHVQIPLRYFFFILIHSQS